MKSVWYPLLTCIALMSCGEENHESYSTEDIQVNFQLENLEGNKVVLEMLTPGSKRLQIDTLEVDQGKGSFHYTANKTSFYSVYVIGKEGEIRFLANPGESVNINANANSLFASARIGGTPENDKMDSLITFIKATRYYTDSLNNELKKVRFNSHLKAPFQELYSVAKIKEESFVLNYILKNPGQYSNLMALSSLDKKRHQKVFQLVDSALIESFPENEDVIKYHNNIKKIYSTIEGKQAPNFTLLDLNETNISLSDFKGKYVLLDFWATYCQPCIKEIPNLKRIQTEFGGDKFEILSVCIDRNSAATYQTWKLINEKYGTDWTQVYDAEGKATLKNYNIKHYPTMMIVDPNGKIIETGDHIRGENAYQIIKKLVGNE